MMPITALNGILTVLYVMLNNPPNAEEVLNFGGIIGYSIYVRIDLISNSFSTGNSSSHSCSFCRFT